MPTCPHCRVGCARPNVYLFGDGRHFVDDESVTRSQAYFQWTEAVTAALSSGNLSEGQGEELVGHCPPGQATLIRINPEFPSNNILLPIKGDMVHHQNNCSSSSNSDGQLPVIGIATTAMAALKQVEAAWCEMDKLALL